jgi:hypothetical protein
MARHRKLTQKFAGFPIFKVGTSGDTFPITSPFTSEFVGLDGLSLDLQFATDKTLTARKGPTPVFTRASTATFVGSNGLIQSAAINAARFDHDPVTLACKGLLIEESRTNLVLQSEDFSTTWSAISATVSVNATTSPNGLVTADKLIVNLLSVTGRLSQNTTLTGSHTFSAFLKASEWSWAFITPSAAVGGVWFNLSNGTIGTQQSGCVGSIVSYGNGWYRCSVTLTGTGVASTARVTPTNADNANTAGDGTSGIFAWGAQLEAGSFPTSYIPTVASSVVRSADVCSITGSDFSGMYNQLEGSLACNYSITSGFTGNRYAASIEDAVGGTLNGFVLRNTNSATSFIAGSGYSSIIGAVTTTASKHILAYSGLTEFVYVKDSVVGTTTGSGTRDPSLPIRMSIGTIEGQNGFTLCGHISAIRYFKKRLPNAKLQILTT